MIHAPCLFCAKDGAAGRLVEHLAFELERPTEHVVPKAEPHRRRAALRMKEEEAVVLAVNRERHERPRTEGGVPGLELQLLGEEGGEPLAGTHEDLLSLRALGDVELVAGHLLHHAREHGLSLDLVKAEDVRPLVVQELHHAADARRVVLEVLNVPGGERECFGHGDPPVSTRPPLSCCLTAPEPLKEPPFRRPYLQCAVPPCRVALPADQRSFTKRCASASARVAASPACCVNCSARNERSSHHSTSRLSTAMTDEGSADTRRRNSPATLSACR